MIILDSELNQELEKQSQELDLKIAAVGGEIDDKLDDDDRNRRLEILINHFEAHESFYLEVKERFPCESDHPQASVLVFGDECTSLGYSLGGNHYALVCLNADEVHAIIARTLPRIENFDTWVLPGSVNDEN